MEVDSLHNSPFVYEIECAVRCGVHESEIDGLRRLDRLAPALNRHLSEETVLLLAQFIKYVHSDDSANHSEATFLQERGELALLCLRSYVSVAEQDPTSPPCAPCPLFGPPPPTPLLIPFFTALLRVVFCEPDISVCDTIRLHRNVSPQFVWSALCLLQNYVVLFCGSLDEFCTEKVFYTKMHGVVVDSLHIATIDVAREAVKLLVLCGLSRGIISEKNAGRKRKRTEEVYDMGALSGTVLEVLAFCNAALGDLGCKGEREGLHWLALSACNLAAFVPTMLSLKRFQKELKKLLQTAVARLLLRIPKDVSLICLSERCLALWVAILSIASPQVLLLSKESDLVDSVIRVTTCPFVTPEMTRSVNALLTVMVETRV